MPTVTDDRIGVFSGISTSPCFLCRSFEALRVRDNRRAFTLPVASSSGQPAGHAVMLQGTIAFKKISCSLIVARTVSLRCFRQLLTWKTPQTNSLRSDSRLFLLQIALIMMEDISLRREQCLPDCAMEEKLERGIKQEHGAG